jgi:hypothetical protein
MLQSGLSLGFHPIYCVDWPRKGPTSAPKQDIRSRFRDGATSKLQLRLCALRRGNSLGSFRVAGSPTVCSASKLLL